MPNLMVLSRRLLRLVQREPTFSELGGFFGLIFIVICFSLLITIAISCDWKSESSKKFPFIGKGWKICTPRAPRYGDMIVRF